MFNARMMMKKNLTMVRFASGFQRKIRSLHAGTDQ